MKIYVPWHTHCSDCGTYSGGTCLGVAFASQAEAEEFLGLNPNPDKGKVWGASQGVFALEINTDALVGALVRADNDAGANPVSEDTREWCAFCGELIGGRCQCDTTLTEEIAMSNWIFTREPPEAIHEWLGWMLDRGGADMGPLCIGFGGDRFSAVADGDGGAFFARDEAGEIVGVVSFSPTGEYGGPGVVGLWTAPDTPGLGGKLLDHACHALTAVPGRVRFDAITLADRRAVAEVALPFRLDARDFATIL